MFHYLLKFTIFETQNRKDFGLELELLGLGILIIFFKPQIFIELCLQFHKFQYLY